ncbi:U32 family peptidase [candidate division KSB1 bacterium]|nr:U32 family peptidase [candidate division KSB1 bacterium]
MVHDHEQKDINRLPGNKSRTDINLTAPAGSFEALCAAIKAGADSVYFGVEDLNMRARAAKPFILSDLTKITKIARKNKISVFLAVNTILYDSDLEKMHTICDSARDAGIDAIIATDIAVIQYARSLDLPVHISTQVNIANIEAVRFYAKYADVMVLARELKLKQIRNIWETINNENITGPSGRLVKIELFAHGALCVSISGKCYMSLALTGHSANRGDCLQSCRRSYIVRDIQDGHELSIDNKFIMSPKDLCTIKFIDNLIDSGATFLKIEGRGRSPEYVYRVTKNYREAIDSYLTGTLDQSKKDHWVTELETVFNRGFWHGGYYCGNPLGEWSASYGSQATQQKSYVGYVINYFQKPRVGQFLIENGELRRGDLVFVTGPTTGYVETHVESIYVNEQPVNVAFKGQNITLPFAEKVRPNDKLFVLRKRTKWQS